MRHERATRLTPLNCKVEITSVIFFLELNVKHVHGGVFRGITVCLSDSLGACTCLSNTYTSRTQHVHVFALLLRIWRFAARFVNLKSVTTRVRVVYMFGKHVHALNLLNINMVMPVLVGRVRV